MDALRKMLYNRQKGMNFLGIPSFCTANELVIEACIRQAARFNDYVLIEATANQVNQYGGYTGMKPADFRDFVLKSRTVTGSIGIESFWAETISVPSLGRTSRKHPQWQNPLNW